jgi:type IV pilus biogenesis protein PilP
MCGNARLRATGFFLLIFAWLANCAVAEELPGKSPTSILVDAGNAESGLSAKPGAAESGPVPSVLREIGQRQTELTILELDLKRAELQKKLRELETTSPLSPPLPPSAQIPAPTAMVQTPGWDAPVVRRIHKVGRDLVALVILPGGETKNVRSGGLIGKGLRVVEIVPDTVFVQQGGQPPVSLPVFQSRRGGS